MKKYWMNKLLLVIFVITMATPVPVQAKVANTQAAEMPVHAAVDAIGEAEAFEQAPVAVGTLVPVMAAADEVDSAPLLVQSGAAAPVGAPMAAGTAGIGYHDDGSTFIDWTGTWTTENSANALGSTYKSSTTVGSTATLEFQGTQISLIYAKALGRGSLEIRIDGQLVTTLSMDGSESWQQRWESPVQADEGPHTILLTHSVAGEVVIDAFEVTNPDPSAALSPGHYEEDDNHFQYTGDWQTWEWEGLSAGENRYTGVQGDSVSVDFTGTQVSLIYTGYLNRGVADIYIDDVLVDSLNQYSAALEFQKRWQSQILGDNGPHTLRIENASNGIIGLDALEIEDIALPDPVGAGTYEDDDQNMVYIGDWTQYASPNTSGGYGHYSNLAGSYALLRFTGTQVTLKYKANVTNGNAEIRIDGVLVQTLDQSASGELFQQEWSSPLMADEGPHTVTITHASGTIIDVDALIIESPSTPGAGTYEDTSQLIAYQGSWTPYDDANASGGSSRYSDQLGSTAQFSFEGDQVSIVYTGYTNRGLVDVRIDGSLVATINQKTSGLSYQQQWDSGVLSGSGTHVLQLTHSFGDIADFDAIIVSDAEPTPTPTGDLTILTDGTYNDTEALLEYTGNWTSYDFAGLYEGNGKYSDQIGSQVSFEFFGTQLSLLYTGFTNRGTVTVQIDSQVVGTINQYSGTVTTQNQWDSVELESAGPHTAVLTHASGALMDLDAVIVSGGGPLPTATETETQTVTITFTPTATAEFEPPDGKEIYRSSYGPYEAGDNPASEAANMDSYGESITGNGQYTVFDSMASNLVYGDNIANPCGATGFSDVYLHNRQTGTNECLSTLYGAAVDGESVEPFISDTGQFVVFVSAASNFSGGTAPQGVKQIYLLNRTSDNLIEVSQDDEYVFANADSYDPIVTSDGQYVIFASDADNLVAGDTNGARDVFIRDMGDRGPDGSYSRSGETTIRVSVASDGSELSAGSQGSVDGFLSDDGTLAAFTSDSPDLTGDGTGQTTQVFLRDLENNTTSLVSKNGSDAAGNGDSWVYGLSSDGRFVMFYSEASDLVTGGNTTEDAYVYDSQLDTITMISVSALQQIDPFPAVEGGKIAFETTKALANEDTNGVKDVYVRGSDGNLLLASLPVGAANTGTYASYNPVISSDGRFVVFTSMVNALDWVDNPPQGGEPILDNMYIRQIAGRWDGPTAGTYDDTSTHIQYGGSWSASSEGSAHDGTIHISSTPGNTASFSFKGRQIGIIYSGYTNRGSIEIRIDGVLVDTLNQYTPTAQWQQRWDSPILGSSGPHTLEITHSTSGVITLDALEVSDTTVVGPGIYDDAGGQIQFQGEWDSDYAGGTYQGSVKYTDDPDASATLSFYGMQVSLIYTEYVTRGNVTIQIDNMDPVTLNQYGETLQYQQRWDSPDLDEGIHTITVSYPEGTHYIDIDAMIVTYPAYELDPPSPITDLEAQTGDDLGTVNLSWTATGDDFENGTASQYIVRYSIAQIETQDDWDGAADVEGEPIPQIAGSDESMTVSGLTPGQFYFFAIRAQDDGANISDLGNSPGARAQDNANTGAGVYDDNNANITYSGVWETYSGAGPYNNSLHLTNIPNSTAIFTFTGTQISLTYTAYSTRGNVEITIDDGDPVLLSQYSGSLLWQQRWDSPLLEAGSHTIVFRHPGGTHYIDVDALEVTNPESIPPSDVADLVAYTGSGKGSVDLTWTAPGDDGIVGTATEYIVRYAETAITNQAEWDAATDLEGEPAPSAANTAEQWTVGGLDPTKMYHFALRTVDDQENVSGLSNDTFAQPNMPPVVELGTYDNPDENILYTGTWGEYNVDGPYSATLQYTNEEDNKAIMRFTGTMVSLIYTKYSSRGTYEITIDDGDPISLNAYDTNLQWQKRWDSDLLSEGTHTIIIRHPGGSHYIDVDAIIVSQPESIAPATISDLNASTGTAVGSVNLNWTAPGDDDMTGTASGYIVRYASTAINSENAWDAATDVSGEPAPAAAGTAQSMVVSGLVPGDTYYFAIRTVDEVPNTSGISNSPSAAAQDLVAVGEGTYDDAGGSVFYSGTWETSAGSGAYGSTIHYSNSPDAAAYFKFNGDQFKLIYTGYSSRGEIYVSIDGNDPVAVNQYTSGLSWQQVWTSPLLDGGEHTIKFSHPGGADYIDIDAITVIVVEN